MSASGSSSRKQLIVGIVFLIVGLTLLSVGVVGVGCRCSTYRGSESWPSTPGTILSSDTLSVDDDGGVDWNVRIRYEYRVDGVRRTAQTIALGFLDEQIGVSSDLRQGTMPLFDEEAPAAELVARYPAGAVVDAYYHPQDPEIVCLERGDPALTDLLMAFFAPLFFGGFGVMIGVMLVWLRS